MVRYDTRRKQLLLVDLCGRLPHRVMLCTPNGNKTLLALLFNKKYNTIVEYDDYLGNENDISEWEGGDIEFVKPYLRPMPSMTEEERKEFNNIPMFKSYYILKYDLPWEIGNYKAIDWLNAHHFDYRGLIEKGLAIEVTKDNNPYEN